MWGWTRGAGRVRRNILAGPFSTKPASMPDRRGMIIKNVSEDALELRLDTRTLHLTAGEERPVTAPEVKDARLRQALQIREIAIVRPTTDAEAEALTEELSAS